MSVDYSASITIPASALEPTPAEARRQAECNAAAAMMGRQVRFWQRMTARDCGLKELPGTRIYLGSRGGPMELFQGPKEDLTVFLEGEREYIEGYRTAKRLEEIGGSKP